MADSDALRDALRPDRPRSTVRGASSFDALLKEVYRGYGERDFEPAPVFGSRVDDTGPPPVDVGKIVEFKTSRRVPPDSLIVMDSNIIERARLGGLRAPGKTNMQREQYERELRRLDQDAFERQYENNFAGEDDYIPVQYVGGMPVSEVVESKPKAPRAPEKGKRRISLGEE